MRQVLQSINGAGTQVRDVPAPICGPTEILVANAASLISAGTERTVVDLANSSLLAKARQRPEEVRRVLQKVAREGLADTWRQVRTRLSEPLALGYSSAGLVLEAGRQVARFRPGDRVATNGAHAEIVAVPHTLAARVPEGVALQDACYAAVAAVALQGVRLTRTGLGDRVAIIGLGLVGQIAAQLAAAAGSHVLGVDRDAARCALASSAGCTVAPPESFAACVEHATEGQGADAVLIAASGDDSRALELAAALARKKARIVAIGLVGLNVPRRDFYNKELALIVSCSYGPGRYDKQYEQKGTDYPYAYVRWTEQRNFEAVLEQMGRGALDVRRLTTHQFPVADAPAAYRLIHEGSEPALGIVLTYPAETADVRRTIELPASAAARAAFDRTAVALVGAGNYSGAVLAPALRATAGVRLRTICSAGGVRAVSLGEHEGFEQATTSYEDVLEDAATDAVFLATPHHLHAGQAVAALRAGKHVFVEKPLATTAEQLADFQGALVALGRGAPLWTVGFNRRFSTAARVVEEFFAGVRGPRTISYRCNAGPLPADHWLNDAQVGGGRLLGEACHALDLASFLARGQIVRIFAETTGEPGAGGSGDHQAAIVARFDNGSVASVGYFTGGSKAFPKERIEVFGGGRVAVIDDFAAVSMTADSRTTEKKTGRDKGHAREVERFVDATRRGTEPPIAYASLLNTSWAALRVVESLKTGLPVDVPVF